MNKQEVLKMASFFLAEPEENLNILEFTFKNRELIVKLENVEDGFVYVGKFGTKEFDFAKNLKEGNFEMTEWVFMKYYKITFDNGETMETGFNGTLKDAENYYLNKFFELDEEKPMATAVKVEEIE